MKICIIAEGSYPYITGGVSSWIQTVLTNMPEHEFIIYSIGAEKKAKGKFKYQLPSNVSHVEEVFLDDFTEEADKWGRDYKLSYKEKKALKSLLDSRQPDWETLLSMFSSDRIDSAVNFLKSKDFFDIVHEICLEKYDQLPFTDMFWSMRSMVLPLFICIKHPLPQADLYHSVSTGYAGVLGSLGKFMYHKPFLLTEHGIYTREREEEIIKAQWVKGYFKDLWIQYFYNMSTCAYDTADKVITLFQKNMEIQEELGCPSSKISIIPNGVNDEDYLLLTSKDTLNQDKLNIGAIVRVVPIKDIKTMLQSFAIVKQELPNSAFYIMGPTEEDEEYYHECLQLVENLQLDDVIFTGEVNVHEYIHKMDVLVLSSISEGQPLVLLEGMACGKPFVATDVGNCKGILLGERDDLGQAGIIVPVMQYVEMAKAIIQLCKDDHKRESMGAIGRERVRHFYTKMSFIDQYKQLYKDLVESIWQE
ncbi:GT4 family glycosyltransferase PelF [Cytobacillus massiliigabonensis]|uniref:GT4 family glycosyltransferase PelF n=1 Tax=Cytobacillus massiliigabonensis TaxID=1871011 RepID=UPI000C829553|nr:GT4 family glycosyltransferase PelF [Cytobacillus massiliigabonensis]